jgi:hypothetical protein
VSLICRLRGVFYSVRYWLGGGVPQFSVDGHEYGPPSYRLGEVEGAPVEWEDLTCTACGHVASAWRRM